MILGLTRNSVQSQVLLIIEYWCLGSIYTIYSRRNKCGCINMHRGPVYIKELRDWPIHEHISVGIGYDNIVQIEEETLKKPCVWKMVWQEYIRSRFRRTVKKRRWNKGGGRLSFQDVDDAHRRYKMGKDEDGSDPSGTTAQITEQGSGLLLLLLLLFLLLLLSVGIL